MGKLIVTEFVTLDGIIDDPGGAEGHPHGGWSMRFPTPDGEQFKFEELLAADVQLMGRVTYEGFAAAWPAMEEITGEFGKRMNNMPKVVVSTTLTEPAWKNTTVISGDVPAEVARLKEQYRATCWSRPAPRWWTRCKSTTWWTSTASWSTRSCSAPASGCSRREQPAPSWRWPAAARSGRTCCC